MVARYEQDSIFAAPNQWHPTNGTRTMAHAPLAGYLLLLDTDWSPVTAKQPGDGKAARERHSQFSRRYQSAV